MGGRASLAGVLWGTLVGAGWAGGLGLVVTQVTRPETKRTLSLRLGNYSQMLRNFYISLYFRTCVRRTARHADLVGPLKFYWEMLTVVCFVID